MTEFFLFAVLAASMWGVFHLGVAVGGITEAMRRRKP